MAITEIRDENNDLTGYYDQDLEIKIPIASDNRDYQRVLETIKAGNTVQEDPNILQKVRKEKIRECKQEALDRIQQFVPEWNTYERIEFLISINNLLDMTKISVAQGKARQVYLFLKNTIIPDINTRLDVRNIKGIDVKVDYVWPT